MVDTRAIGAEFLNPVVDLDNTTNGYGRRGESIPFTTA